MILNKTRNLFLLLAVLAMAGFVAVWIATRWGIGITPDSIAYISGARSLIAETGYRMPDGEIITHYPPFFSILAAMIATSGLDVLVSARVLNSLLFSVNIAFVGILLYKLLPDDQHKKRLIPLLGALFILLSADMLDAHTMAWTEPVYIFMGNLGFVLISLYLDKGRFAYLMLSAVILGLTVLTRYVGISLLATGALGLFLFVRQKFLHRVISVIAFSFVGMLPAIAWTIRNIVFGGTATSRELSFHPLSQNHIWEALATLSTWLIVPGSIYTGKRMLIFLLVLCIGFAIWLARLSKYREYLHTRKIWLFIQNQPAMIKLVSLYIPVYLGVILAANTTLDAYTPLDGRILLPVYVSLLILVLYVIGIFLQAERPSIALSLSMGVIVVIFIAGYGSRFLHKTYQGYSEGLGFNSRQWHSSETIEAVRLLPASTVIFSNAPEAIYIHADRPANKIPKKFLSINSQPNLAYMEEMTVLKEEMVNGGKIVWFDLPWRSSPPDKEDLTLELQLNVFASLSDGNILSVESGN
jgi:hypothetical protein